MPSRWSAPTAKPGSPPGWSPPRSTGSCTRPRWSCCTRPGTDSRCRAWPGGSWRSASWPPWRRTWPTGGPMDQSARPSRPGLRPALWVATSFCCGSSGPLPLAAWSANRLWTRQAGQRTTQPLGCGWCRCPTWTRQGIGAHRIATSGPAVRATVAWDERWCGLGQRARPARCGPCVPVRGPGSDRLARLDGVGGTGEDSEEDINVAAVAAYRASIDSGKPLSERKLAAMFGKTSRRWARNRMAEAVEGVASAMADAR